MCLLPAWWSVVTDMSDNNLPTCPCYIEATTGPEVEFFKNGHGFQVVEYHEAGEVRERHTNQAAESRRCCILHYIVRVGVERHVNRWRVPC